MSELSQHAKLIKAIEIAKGAQVGIELSYFDVLEVAGELNEAKEVVAMLHTRIAELEGEVTKCHELKDSYCDCIEELEAENDRLQDTWFEDETICPDGSLKPKVSTLLSRIAELEAEKCVLIDQQREAKNHLIDKNLHIDSLYEEGYKLQQRIAELEAERDQAKAIVSRLRDFLFDYTQFHISTNPEERWWALVDKFDELVKERER